MSAADHLKNIRERVEALDPVWMEARSDAEKDRARLLDALERVLELHKRERAYQGRYVCSCESWHPCPTVRTINDALEGK